MPLKSIQTILAGSNCARIRTVCVFTFADGAVIMGAENDDRSFDLRQEGDKK
jgi:hypothetical protein